MNSKKRVPALLSVLFAAALALILTYSQADRRLLWWQAWSESSVFIREKLGLTNTCPVCRQASVFRTVGLRQRPKALCIICGSLERHRLLYLYLERKTNLFDAELSVLHFSPIKGMVQALRAQENLNYVTSEYDQPADLQLDLTDLALPDNSWDVIICYHVLEHITEDGKAMSEMYRVLKPGGWAVVQVPVREAPDTLEDPTIQTPEQRLKTFGQADHVRHYGWKDFAYRLEQAGFEVAIEQLGRKLSDDLAKEYSVHPNERIYLLRKPKSVDPEPPPTSTTEVPRPAST